MPLHGDYHKIIETACYECFVDVTAWKPFKEGGEGSVSVGYMSGHTQAYASSIRGRLKLAWDALRNLPWWRIYWEALTPEDVDAVCAALQEAKAVAFGGQAAE